MILLFNLKKWRIDDVVVWLDADHDGLGRLGRGYSFIERTLLLLTFRLGIIP